MRTFVIVGHKATTSPNFSLEDIPGTSGRLDILCRAVTAAFVISHGIRKDASVYLVLLGGEAPKTILLHGESLRHLNPDERTTAALLKKALALPATERWAMSTSGITVRLGGLPELLEDLKEADLVYLKEDGPDIRRHGRHQLRREDCFHPGRPHRNDGGGGGADGPGRGQDSLVGGDEPARRPLHCHIELDAGQQCIYAGMKSNISCILIGDMKCPI